MSSVDSPASSADSNDFLHYGSFTEVLYWFGTDPRSVNTEGIEGGMRTRFKFDTPQGYSTLTRTILTDEAHNQVKIAEFGWTGQFDLGQCTIFGAHNHETQFPMAFLVRPGSTPKSRRFHLLSNSSRYFEWIADDKTPDSFYLYDMCTPNVTQIASFAVCPPNSENFRAFMQYRFRSPELFILSLLSLTVIRCLRYSGQLPC